jgi:hypothetical protein
MHALPNRHELRRGYHQNIYQRQHTPFDLAPLIVNTYFENQEWLCAVWCWVARLCQRLQALEMAVRHRLSMEAAEAMMTR